MAQELSGLNQAVEKAFQEVLDSCTVTSEEDYIKAAKDWFDRQERTTKNWSVFYSLIDKLLQKVIDDDADAAMEQVLGNKESPMEWLDRQRKDQHTWKVYYVLVEKYQQRAGERLVDSLSAHHEE